MLYSIDRILTTHAGSLPRPPDLRDMVFAKANGEPYDPTELDERLKSAVAEVVRRQVESGIDCVNDGELSKTNFTDCVRWRIAGYEARPSSGARRLSITARDERKFAGYFAADPRIDPAGSQQQAASVSAYSSLCRRWRTMNASTLSRHRSSGVNVPELLPARHSGHD